MDDQELSRAITAYVDAGIADDADLRERIVRAASEPRRARFGLRRRRWSIFGGVVLALVAGGALTVANANLPVRLELLPSPSSTPISGAAAVKDPGASSGRASARTDDQRPSGGPTSAAPLGKVPASLITIEAARAAFGADMLSLASPEAALTAAYFAPAVPVPAGAKAGTPPLPDRVELVYAVSGHQVMLQEERDVAGTPLTVLAANVNGSAALKTDAGLGPADVETVDGSQYAVGRSTDGTTVATITWKTVGGVDVTMRFDPGLDRATAFALVALVR
jgi:hypothetical protein